MPATPETSRTAEARPTGLALLLAALLALGLGGLARAQDEGDTQDEGKAAAKAGDAPADEPEAEAEPAPDEAQAEMWGDPLRFELLENTFPELQVPFLTPNDANAVLKMAGGATTDPTVVQRYVQHFAGELTRHSNIDSLLDTTAEKSNGARAMEEASNALLRPLLDPVTPNNSRFRQLYLGDLMELAPKLLQGHLHTRTFAMVVLSRSKSPAVVPFLIEQIKADDQPMVVKMLAAVGLVNISQRGKAPLDASSQAIPAAQALADWLTANPDLFWPLKIRALEAMGAMRMATAQPLGGKAELAAVPFAILVNPDERPDVRAWAGWALGMMDVPAQIRKFNFPLVAYALGRAAADLGTEIAEIPMPEDQPTKNLRLVERKVDPMISLLSALAGDPNLPRSGLAGTSHTEAVAARNAIRDVEQRVRAVTTSAIALSRAVGRQVPDFHKRLVADVQELKSYLAKNVPENLELYSGGPSLELPGAASSSGGESKTTTKGAAGGSSR